MKSPKGFVFHYFAQSSIKSILLWYKCTIADLHSIHAFISGFVSKMWFQHGGFVLCGIFVLAGSLIMTLIDVHKSNIRKRKRSRREAKAKHHQQLSEKPSSFIPDEGSSSHQSDPGGHFVASGMFLGSPVLSRRSAGGSLDILERQNSFTDQDDILPPVSLLSHQRSFILDDLIEFNQPEVTIYSEEGIADMDLPENILFDDLDYLDNITSCDKVENCLMLSEYEQNLIKETEGGNSFASGLRRMGRKWSLLRQPTLQTIHSESEDVSVTLHNNNGGPEAAEAVLTEDSVSYSASRHNSPLRSSKGKSLFFNNKKRSITTVTEENYSTSSAS